MYAEVKMVLSKPLAPMIIGLCLAMLILWQLSVVALSFFSPGKMATQQGIKIVEEKRAMKGALADAGLNTIFFGDYVPENLKDASVKQSKLNLDMVGIIFADDEQDSHVIISEGGQEKIYYVGDTLPGNVIIKRITTDGVFVIRDGSLESLSFPNSDLIFEPVAKPLIGE